FQSALRDYARDQLLARGVEVRLDTAIREVTNDRVLLANGEDLASDVTVWAAGVSAPAVTGEWGLPQGRGGRILVGPDLRVQGQDRIFALGDISLVEDRPRPQLRRRRVAAPAADPRHTSLASLARAAPDHLARQPQPHLRAAQPVLALC